MQACPCRCPYRAPSASALLTGAPSAQGVTELVPREDRDTAGQVFHGFNQDAYRAELTRCCRAAGVPHFSPHGLRHRRISLWHHQGVPWATIGQRVGQRNLSTTANNYTHVMPDAGELDRGRHVAPC